MFNHILVAVDERGHAEHAVTVAADLAAKYQCPLFVMTVMSESGLVADLGEMAQGEGLYAGEITQRLLDQAERVAAKAGAPKVMRLDLEGDPVKIILSAAKANHVDLIVMGAHGGSGSRDVPHEVSTQAEAACLILR